MAHIVNLRHARPAGGARRQGGARRDRADRPRSQWGNRFRIGPDGPRDEVIARYRAEPHSRRRGRASDARRCPAMGRSSPAPRHGRPPSWRNGGESEAGEGRTPRGGRERAPGTGNTEGEPKCNPLPRGASPVRVEGLPRWQSRLRGCGATRRYASVAVTGHAVFGRSLRAGLLRCNLRSAPISASIPIASARWRSLRAPLAGPAPETRVSIPEPHRASGTVANNIPLDVMAHCPTRARCANPASGGVLLFVPALARKATALRA